MKKHFLPSVFMLIVALLFFGTAWAEQTGEGKETKPSEAKPANMSSTVAAGAAAEASKGAKEGSKQAKPEYRPFGDVLGDAETIDGLIKLYRKAMDFSAR